MITTSDSLSMHGQWKRAKVCFSDFCPQAPSSFIPSSLPAWNVLRLYLIARACASLLPLLPRPSTRPSVRPRRRAHLRLPARPRLRPLLPRQHLQPSPARALWPQEAYSYTKLLNGQFLGVRRGSILVEGRLTPSCVLRGRGGRLAGRTTAPCAWSGLINSVPELIQCGHR